MRIFNFLDFILEAREESLLPVIISEEFYEKINKIDSPISSKLKAIKKDRPLSEYSFISSGSSEETVKYTDTYKLDKYLRDKYNTSVDFDTSKYLKKVSEWDSSSDIWNENRTEIKIGRFIKRFFGTEYTDVEIEKFVNQWKSLEENSTFEIWEGWKIKEGYKSNNYFFAENSSNSLINSCMNDQTNLIEFYQYCPSAKLLVLLDENNLILGRALVWTDYMNKVIMDRVYYALDKDYHKFVYYAKKNGWFYKKRNISGGSSFIKDTTEVFLKTKVKVPNVFKYEEEGESFPYMDTFYYAQNEWCMNYEPSDSEYYKLNDTDGAFEHYNNLYDAHGQSIASDDEYDYVHSNEQDGLIYRDDSIYVDYNGGQGFDDYKFSDWVEKSYLENPKNDFIKIGEEWYNKKDCVWSEKEKSWIYRPDAIWNKKDWVSWDKFNPGENNI